MKKLLTFVLFSTWSFASIACDCEWAGDFLTAGIKEELVVKVKIIDHFKGDSTVQQTYDGVNERMAVEIISTYKGKEKRKLISIWGDNGGLCRPYVDYFEKGQIFFLALNKMDEPGDYEVRNCGEFYLAIKNGKVKGERKIRPELYQTKEIELREFENKLKNITPANSTFSIGGDSCSADSFVAT